MNIPNYYAILQITPDATEAEIRRAYHARVRQCHPDLHPQSTAAHELIKQVNLAGEVLCHPERRRRYDQLYAIGISNAQHSPCDCTGGQGYDVEYSITITQAEAHHGTQRSLVFHNQQGRPAPRSIIIPAGITAGSRLYCRGQGGPNRAGTHYGDLYVAVVIATSQPDSYQHLSQAHTLPSEVYFRLPDWFTWLFGD